MPLEFWTEKSMHALFAFGVWKRFALLDDDFDFLVDFGT